MMPPSGRVFSKHPKSQRSDALANPLFHRFAVILQLIEQGSFLRYSYPALLRQPANGYREFGTFARQSQMSKMFFSPASVATYKPFPHVESSFSPPLMLASGRLAPHPHGKWAISIFRSPHVPANDSPRH